ncbi:MAG: S41 family peptidase [Candidatus Aminicenantales bacterium]
MKKISLIFLAFFLGLNVFLLFYKGIITAKSATAPVDKPFELLVSVFQLIKTEYIDEKDPTETMEGALRGLVNSLDPLSGYLNPEMTTLYLELQKDPITFDMGLLLMKRYGFFPVVVGIRPNSPAQRADFRVGDYITEIDGKPTSSISLAETRLQLRNKKKTSVTLKVLRDEQTRVITLDRERLMDLPYSFQPLAGTKGWFQVYAFYPPLVKDLSQKVLPRLAKSDGPLIIDLRFAQEGNLEEALKFLNQFLSAEKIGYFKGRLGDPQFLSCSQPAPLANLNLAIWVSPATQDLAELVAAALQRIKKIQVIGQATPGLFAKREFFLLRDGTSFFLTTGVGYLSSDVPLWGKGVEPDVKLDLDVNDPTVYFQKTLDLQRRS